MAAEAAATLRLDTCPSLFSSSSPPVGRTGICRSSFLVCLLTVWLKPEDWDGALVAFQIQMLADERMYLREGSGSFMKVL